MSCYFIHRPNAKSIEGYDKPIKCVLFLHGLNAARNLAHQFIEDLSERGVWVFEARLTGHSPSQQVTGQNLQQQWEDDFYWFEQKFRETISSEFNSSELNSTEPEPNSPQVHTSFIGFSLGGLLGSRFLSSYFKNVLLLAPALDLTALSKQGASLLSHYPGKPFPSFFNPGMRHSTVVCSTPYRALLNLIERPLSTNLNPNMLKIFVHDKDMMVSAKKIRKLFPEVTTISRYQNPLKAHFLIYKNFQSESFWTELLEQI